MQGRGGDWHEEAKKMAGIYLNATFTVAAVDGTRLRDVAPTQPFLAEESQFRRDKDWSNLEKVYEVLEETGNFTFRENGELDTRGWAFQEKMLSKRLISLTKKDVFWDCLHHSASGRRPTGILGDFSPGFRDSDDRNFKRFLLRSPAATPTFSPSEGYWYWRKAVEEYTSRELTFGKDRLIALDGIIRRMSDVLSDTHEVGIWRKDILRSLIWFADLAGRHSYLPVVEAPSWSWVSVDSSISYRLWHPHERYHRNKQEKLTPISKVRRLPVDHSHFSSPTGTLEIHGPVVEGYVVGDVVFIYKNEVQRRHSRKSPAEVRQEIENDEVIAYDQRLFHQARFLRDPRPYDERHRQVEITRTSGPGFARVQVLQPLRVRCILLCEGGYTNPLTAQYSLVLAGYNWQLKDHWHSMPSFCQRVGLCSVDVLQLCFHSRLTCPRRVITGHICLGTNSTVEI